MVDIRPKKQFQACHIPKSINLAPFELKTKSWLKRKNLVLINDQPTPPYELMARLEKMNFRVSSLQGGLRAWQQAGGTLKGDPFAIRQLPGISAEDFSRLKDESWLIVHFAEEEEEEVQGEEMLTLVIRSKDELVHHVEQLTAQQAEAPVLFMDEHGEWRDELLGLLRNKPNAWTLSGGHEAMLRHVNLSNQIPEHRTSSLHLAKKRPETGLDSNKKKDCGCNKKKHTH